VEELGRVACVEVVLHADELVEDAHPPQRHVGGEDRLAEIRSVDDVASTASGSVGTEKTDSHARRPVTAAPASFARETAVAKSYVSAKYASPHADWGSPGSPSIIPRCTAASTARAPAMSRRRDANRSRGKIAHATTMAKPVSAVETNATGASVGVGADGLRAR
jgi:hypothetical protein